MPGFARGVALCLCSAIAAALPGPAASQTPPRQISPDIVAPPPLDPDELTREPPRGPLGELGLAGPPKPRKVERGPNLYNPRATAAGVVEARGLSVTISGVDIVGVNEFCMAGGEHWACGLRARTAFRGFLRGRAIACDLPPDVQAGSVSTTCTVGRQDVGHWLVSNGWARAAVSGPYTDAGEKAKAAGRGIFGSAPDLAGLMPEPEPFESSSADQPVMAPETGVPEPSLPPAPTPPAGLRGPF